jgi:hypothetical protein
MCTPLFFHRGALVRLVLLPWVALGLTPVAAVAAPAALVDISWSPQGRFNHQASVAPAKFVELCGRLPAAVQVQWAFEASAPLDFNVHHHVGKEVVYAAQLKGATQAGDTLTTPVAQDYCWMWVNKGSAAVVLNVSLQR